MPVSRGWSVRTQRRMEELKCFSLVKGADSLLAAFMIRPASRSVGEGSVDEEGGGDGSELVVELEDAAVSGVGVDDQLGTLDPAVQVLGKDRGHHPVVVTVGDQRRLGDDRE